MNQELQVSVKFSDLTYTTKALTTQSLARYIAIFRKKRAPIHKILSHAGTKDGTPDLTLKTATGKKRFKSIFDST